MYFKLDYLELLGKHWLLNRAPMLGDWRSSAGLERRWIGAAKTAWRVASDARKDGAATGVSFLLARVCLCWLREDGFRNRETSETWLADGGNGITAPWLGSADQVWFNQNEHILAWASSIIGSPVLLIYKLYIYIYIIEVPKFYSFLRILNFRYLINIRKIEIHI
jgi:hypothetical protein